MKTVFDAVSAADVAAVLGVTRDTVLRMARKGELPCVRLNRKAIVFRRSSLERFLTKHEQPAVR